MTTGGQGMANGDEPGAATGTPQPKPLLAPPPSWEAGRWRLQLRVREQGKCGVLAERQRTHAPRRCPPQDLSLVPWQNLSPWGSVNADAARSVAGRTLKLFTASASSSPARARVSLLSRSDTTATGGTCGGVAMCLVVGRPARECNQVWLPRAE
jgi:hypothetical protein